MNSLRCEVSVDQWIPKRLKWVSRRFRGVRDTRCEGRRAAIKHSSCRKSLLLTLRKSPFQAGRREIEKSAQLQRQQSLTRIDETDWPGRRLELSECTRKCAGSQRARGLVRKHARDPDARDGCIDGRFGGVDNEARVASTREGFCDRAVTRPADQPRNRCQRQPRTPARSLGYFN
jgi:hypothetical protein